MTEKLNSSTEELLESISGKNQKIGTFHTGFVIDKVHQDCSQNQFLRELAVNSIEAGAKNIWFGPSWWHCQHLGTWKLAWVDDGVGMSKKELSDFMGRLSSSGKGQDQAGNFGVGAKVTCFPHSPWSTEYITWKDGKCSYMQIVKNSATGEYEILQQATGESVLEVDIDNPMSKSFMPKIIEKSGHGTMVVLGGRDEDDSTYRPEGSSSYWIHNYLAERFYELPSSVKSLMGERFHKTDRKTWPLSQAQRNSTNTHNRKVHTAKDTLKNFSIEHGTVKIDDAKVHWYIKAPKGHRNGNHDKQGRIWGMVAVLHDGELYDRYIGNANRAKQQQFGVTFGYKDVTLVIEPDNDLSVVSNIARNRLYLAGEEGQSNSELPWEDFARQFHTSRPPELVAYIREQQEKADISDPTESNKMAQHMIQEVGNFGRYKKTPSSSVCADGSSQGGQVTPRNGTKRKNGKRGGGSGGSRGMGAYLAAESFSSQSEPAKKLRENFWEITAVWLSVKDGSREPSDLADRAASVTSQDGAVGIININADFRPFHSVYGTIARELGGETDPLSLSIAATAMRPFIEATLKSTVQLALALSKVQPGTPWNDSERGQLLSEEALTLRCTNLYYERKDCLKVAKKAYSAALATQTFTDVDVDSGSDLEEELAEILA